MKKFKHCSESMVTLSQLMLPSNSNFSGKIHGGYILNLMDQIAFACGSKHSGNYCVTASVNTVDFINPIEVGELVTMNASVNYVGNTSMIIGIRVNAENIQTGKIKHCNSSYFTMIAKGADEKPTKVPGLILKTDDDARRFLKSIAQLQTKHNSAKQFEEDNFTLNGNRRTILENYNVDIKI